MRFSTVEQHMRSGPYSGRERHHDHFQSPAGVFHHLIEPASPSSSERPSHLAKRQPNAPKHLPEPSCTLMQERPALALTSPSQVLAKTQKCRLSKNLLPKIRFAQENGFRISKTRESRVGAWAYLVSNNGE